MTIWELRSTPLKLHFSRRSAALRPCISSQTTAHVSSSSLALNYKCPNHFNTANHNYFVPLRLVMTFTFINPFAQNPAARLSYIGLLVPFLVLTFQINHYKCILVTRQSGKCAYANFAKYAISTNFLSSKCQATNISISALFIESFIAFDERLGRPLKLAIVGLTDALLYSQAMMLIT